MTIFIIDIVNCEFICYLCAEVYNTSQEWNFNNINYLTILPR